MVNQNAVESVESDDEMVADENLQDTEDDQDANAKNTYGTIEGPTNTGHPEIWTVRWKVPNVTHNDIHKVNSPPFTISGVKWSILLQLMDDQDGRTNLGVFLDSALMEEISHDFKVEAVFEIAAENKDALQTEAKPLYHCFTRESTDWGFRDLVKNSLVTDPLAGFLIDDVLSLKITVRVLKDYEAREYNLRKQPDLWLHDSKTETGYVGLKNQGATCYMNSLLQSLYHVPALQRAVYKMPTEQETSFKRQRSASRHPAIITRQENSNTQESVALALQRVFYHLQHSSKSVGTKQLTRSFGWDAHDAFTQHDVQELDRVLCENLEDKMKGTEVEHEVPRLFRGKLKNFVKCLNVDFSSERMEYFYDLSLNVRGCKNLAESFKKYTEKERLDGDNKYMAEGHGLQDAVKGCSFSAFPPVLHLHLKRFEYDPLRDANVKINDRFEFDESIDLAPYLEQHPGHEEIYLLHSVLVHSGDVHAGHYYAYIRPDCKGKWYKFNDERVNISNREEAVESNFGFEEESDRLMGQSLMIQRNRLAPRRFSNAYMIVYVKQDAVQDVLRPLGNDDIPSHLQQRFKIEEEEEDLRRKEKAEAHLKLTLKVATWKHLQKHDDVDLHDWQDVLMLLVYKTMTLDELKKTIRETAELEAEDLRLWPCCKRKNETIRTQSPLRVPGGTLLKDIRAFQQNAVHAVDVKIFVEQLPQGDLSAERFDDRDALIFFKYWDPSKRRLMHIGSHIFKSTTKVRMMVEKACALFLPKLDVSEIEALEELKPDKIENLLYYVPDEVHSGEREAQLQDKQVELQSGDIIVIQSASVSRTDDCVKVHYDYLCCKVLVSFRARSTPDKEAFEMHLHGGLTYAAVCNAVANRLNELKIAERSPASGDKLQLCKHLHKDGPNSTPAERKADVLLRDLLNGLYGAEKFILYYEELWYSIEDLKKNMLLRYRTINAGLVDQEECLVDRGATAVTEVLQHARSHLSPSYSPPEMFLCNVRMGKIEHIFPEDGEDRKEELIRVSESHGLHVIGISAQAGGVAGSFVGGYDVNNVHSHTGWLLPVYHFEMVRARNNMQQGTVAAVQERRFYGVPLLVRVKAEETVADLKRKIHNALEQQSRQHKDSESSDSKISEWGVWLFFECTNREPEELTDEAISLDAAKCTEEGCHLGVEHPDKNRYAKISPAFRTVEKAIKIMR